MKIIVCIKQVPEVEDLKFDTETRTLIREGVENIINPFDRRAITQAVALKEQLGGEVLVVTMGPPQAEEALVEALAMGVDRAIHLVDRAFAGADTLATSRTLAMLIEREGCDLVFCGRYSVDAETGQVGPEVAELLHIPQVTGVRKVEVQPGGKSLLAERETDDGYEVLDVPLPALLTAAERLIFPKKVTPEDLKAAREKPLSRLSAADLSPDLSLFGAAGSPTRVEQIYSVESKRAAEMIPTEDPDAAAAELVRRLLKKGLFRRWQEESDQAGSRVSSQRKIDHPEKAVWVVAESYRGKFRPVTFELLGKGIELATRLRSELVAVLIGNSISEPSQILGGYGADRVLLLDHPALRDYSSEGYSEALAAAIERNKPFVVLIPATANGRDFAPRVAARLGLGLTGDCVGLELNSEGRLVQLKPAFGGNIVAPIVSRTDPQMATVRPGILKTPALLEGKQAPVENFTPDLKPVSTRLVRVVPELDEAAMALDTAEVVISVGMGIGGPENLPVIADLARVLDARIGGSRKVVDKGWILRQQQIGLTGKTISPKLYIAIGISGAFNHTIGMQRADNVVAINTNPKAPIFQHATFGLVGDWKVLVPVLTRHLQMVRGEMRK